MTLEDGTRLRWRDGKAEMRPSKRRPAALQFDGASIALVFGMPMACCDDLPSDGRVQLLQIELQDDVVHVDGASYTGDGRRIR